MPPNEPFWPRVAIILIVAIVGSGLAHCASGCTPAPLAAFAASAARFASLAHPPLVAAYAAEQRACLSLAESAWDGCIAGVRERWAPVRKVATELRVSWCSFEPSKCPAEVGP